MSPGTRWAVDEGADICAFEVGIPGCGDHRRPVIPAVRQTGRMTTEIHGQVADGFEAVRDAFAANFEKHGEIGAAFSLYHRGSKVVDLWGGVADVASARPWTEDTLQLVFSTTKGATAVCANLLVQRGELDLDAPVASYWPEFEAEGKGDIPVRWLLSHRSGLPAVDDKPAPGVLLDWDAICALLAAQKPYWEPGTTHGYHALTYGWLVGEVVRRVSGKSLGSFFKDEVATPLGLDFHIGLPAALEPRVSTLNTLGQMPGADGVDVATIDWDAIPEAARAIARAFLDPNSITNRALSVSSPPLEFNSPEVHAAEIPAANGITDARSLARMYASLVGEVDGVRLFTPETVKAVSTEQSNGPDTVLMVPTRFGLGYFLDSGFAPLLGANSFGHAGAGGSLGFCDPDAEIGFGYVMNQMQQNLSGDPRTLGLIAAVKSSI